MSRLGSWLVIAGSIVVGGTFVIAGALKSLDVDGFARDIALHGILGPAPAAVLARVLVPFEIVVGTAAIIGYRRRLALWLLTAALAVFVAATAFAWSQGHTEGCGCFGRFAARTPLSVIVEDLILMAAAVPGLLLPRGGGDRIFRTRSMGTENPKSAPQGMPPDPLLRRRDAAPWVRWRAPFLAVLALLTTAFTLASPFLPIDGLATALRPGVRLSDLGLDRIAGNLAEGDRLLVILVLNEPASQGSVAALNALGQSPGAPPIAALTDATETQRAEFFWTHAPAFEFVEVPAQDLHRLYRRAPRAFRVHNGVVSQVWEGIPHVEELAR